MDDSIRVMVERGKKTRVVASGFDWPGWDRRGKSEDDALRVRAGCRPRYAKVAALAGLAGEVGATGTCSTTRGKRKTGTSRGQLDDRPPR
jgi:hypothetical protein